MARILRKAAALALVLVMCLTSFDLAFVSAASDEPLKTPTGILFTPVTEDSVTINWDAVPEADYYNIYRRDSGKSTWTVIANTTGAAVTFVDNTVEAKHDYWYKVSAVNEFSESEPTKEAFIMLANNEAVLLSNFNVKTKGSRLRLGDLDGDGRTEILVCNTSKQSNYTTNGSVLYLLIAYNLEGQVLWEFTLDPAYDGTGSGVTSTSSDEPVNIYDVDGDGYNDVVAICHPKKDRGANYNGAFFVILDGRTGKIKLDSKGNECKKPLSELNVPGLSSTGSGTASVNSLGDCLVFADLDGRIVNGKKGVRQFVTLKGRYENLTAFEMFNVDGEFIMEYKWRHTTRQSGQTSSQTLTGHMPLAVDLNGDGVDEIISNYTVFKADGSVFWYIPTKIVDAAGNPIYIPGTTQQWQASDHVDTIQVGDVDGNPDNGLEVVFGGGGAGVSTFCYSWDGKFIWGNNVAREPQSVLLADFRTEANGLEIVGLDRRVRNTTTHDYDGMFEISSNGDTLYKEANNYQGFGTIVIRVSNWTGTYAPLNASFFRNGNKAQTVTPYVNPGEDGSGYVNIGRNPELDKAPTLYDGYFNPLFELPGVDNRFMAMDLCGDARDELVAYNDNGEIFIYSNGRNDLKDGITGVPKPQSQFMANYSRYPTDIFIPTIATRTPARPSALKPITQSVYIDWIPVMGATGYTLYRNGIKLGDFIDVGYLDETIEPGTEYSYTVAAFDGKNTSPQSMPLIIKGDEYNTLNLDVTTTANLVKKGDYFDVKVSFPQTTTTNAVSFVLSYDKDKFEYAGNLGADPSQDTYIDGVTYLTSDAGEGSIKLTMMIPDYKAKDLVSVRFRAKESADIQNADNSISAKADLVYKNANGNKIVLSASGSTDFTTSGNPGDTDADGKVTLLDLSNIIDMFGVKSGDALWAKAKFFDFNKNKVIDIADIVAIAKLIF